MAKKAQEFFYVDSKGRQQDADLHGPILARGDVARGLREAFKVDESIMAPIRERNRAKWLRRQRMGDYNPYHVESGPKGGQFTSGASGSWSPSITFAKATPQQFIAARDKTVRPGFLSPLKPEDIADHELFVNPEGTVGFALSDGDIQNVFNNGGPKGAGAQAILTAIQKGGRVLDCYDGFLPSFYRQFGFVETNRMKFNPEFAPPGWDAATYGAPDVVFMGWQGFGRSAISALRRATGPKDKWATNKLSTDYTDDWDGAKETSRSRARR